MPYLQINDTLAIMYLNSTFERSDASNKIDPVQFGMLEKVLWFGLRGWYFWLKLVLKLKLK